MVQNYTPIDHLIKNSSPAPGFHPKGPESEPGSTLHPPEHVQVHEHVEHKVEDPHVQPYVEEKLQNANVPQDLQKSGVKPVEKTGKFARLQNVKIPISDEKVLAGQQAPISSSIRWLSELATYMLKKAHIKLKRIGGKVVRVVST